MNYQNNKKYFLFIIFIIYFKLTNYDNFAYGMLYPKAFQLNNGNIIIAGNTEINVYDSTGLILFNYTINETITNTQDAYYTTFAQFPEKYNSVIIVIVMHEIFILNYDGEYIFENLLTINSNTHKFYSLVPILIKMKIIILY